MIKILENTFSTVFINISTALTTITTNKILIRIRVFAPRRFHPEDRDINDMIFLRRALRLSYTISNCTVYTGRTL